MHELHLLGNTVYAGAPLNAASRALVMVHGRGDASDKMVQLSRVLVTDDHTALVFPKATNNTWYPKSFLAPVAENQPWLDSALANLDGVVANIKAHGLGEGKIFLLGFSQGACLTMEYACRHATRYAGIVVLSGGLIGPEVEESNYHGDFGGTPVFMGCSDTDFHIPLQRLYDSEAVATAMGARVNLHIYPGMDHTIIEDEIQQVRLILNQ